MSPAFNGEYGGVQASARIAWSGLRQNAAVQKAELLTYASGAGMAKLVSKLSFLARASRIPPSFDVVLVWHLGLLKTLLTLRTGMARIAVFLHGIEAWQPLDGLTTHLLEKADLLFHNSEHTWQKFLQVNRGFRGHRHEQVALGIDSAVQHCAPDPGFPPAALMLGRLDPRENYKGHREVIEAWPFVRSAIPKAELWIAGDGPLLPTLRDLVRRMNIEASVRFFGAVSEEYKQELLARSRCLALPSRGEGFGLVYLEAMRLGRPCLVGRSDAGREVVAPGQAGIAVDVESRLDIAAGLAQLLGQSTRWKAMSENARRQYEAHFTAAHFQSRLLATLLAECPAEKREPIVT